MTLLGLIIVLLVVGAALYIIRLLPIDPTVKTVITVLVLVIIAIYILRALLGSSLDIKL